MKICPTCRYCYEDTEVVCSLDPSHGKLLPSRHGTCIIAEKYRLERLLGRGGMGAVYAGIHVELERPVAIKLLLPDLVADPQALERFRREARAAARLNHPSVVDTYDYGVLAGGEAYIVMEIVAGYTLREYMNASAELPFSEAVSIARQVADGVEVAHRSGIIHRDLKPSNIILTRDHHDYLLPKVVDFGIAKLKEQTTSGGMAGITSTGSLVGTPRYMSPEQCAGYEIDARSDIYSLGVILYEMLAGRPPFDAPSATAIALKHVQEQPPPLENWRPDVPEMLAAIVSKALAKSPEERQQTAAEFARGLRAFEDSERRVLEIQTDGSTPDFAPSTNAHTPSLQTSPNIQPLSDTSAFKKTETGRHAHEPASPTGRAGEPTREETGETIAPHKPPAPNLDAAPGIIAGSSQARPVQGSDQSLSQEKRVSGSAEQARGTAEATSTRTPSEITATQTAPDGAAKTERAAPPESSARSDRTAPPDEQHAPRSRRLPLIYAAVGLAVVIGLVALLFTLWRPAQDRSQASLSTGATQRAGEKVSDNPSAPDSGAQAPARDSAPSNNNSMSATTTVPQEAGVPPLVDEKEMVEAPEQERAALRASLMQWVAATNSRSIERQMTFYSPRLTAYYLNRDVPSASVRAEKMRAFAQAALVKISTTEPVIRIASNGQTAIMRFRKEYVIQGAGVDRHGEVLQELGWVKTGRGWKIISERDLQVIR